MNKYEAERIIERFFNKDNISSDDEFLFIEASNYLIDTEHDVNAMVNLGGYYYEKEKYILAEKYYLMAFEAGDDWVSDGLGYIYYYGRTGKRDYSKALYYFSIARDKGNYEAAMKIADMYHNGYGVEKDDKKYLEILLDIYEKIKDSDDLFTPYPEVAHRLADIYIVNGNGEDTVEMLLKAKSFIAQRIRFNPFWGNFIVARRVVTLLYKVVEFDYNQIDFLDLFYLLATPHKVNLIYQGKIYEIESLYDEDVIRVKCQDRNYKSIENFLINALFNNKHTYVIDYEDYYSIEMKEE